MTGTLRGLLFACAVLWPTFLRAQTPPPGTIEYYHVDAIGSLRAVTDASGTVVRTQHYYPFGEGVGVAAGADPMGFTGKPRDAETGLDYFGARFYAQRHGRFTSVDPIHAWRDSLLDSQRWNKYSYGRNNPLRFVDLDGRCVYPGADCKQYLTGGVKALLNVVPDSISLVNKAANLVIAPLTDFRFGDVPRFQASNRDQGRGMFAAGITMLFAPAGASSSAAKSGSFAISFGRNENATYHAFRHIEAAGLSRGAVQEAVLAHAKQVGAGMSPGQLVTHTIRVGDREVTYNAFMLKDGSLNVGRIIPR